MKMNLNVHDGRTDRFYDEISRCENMDDINTFFDKYSSFFVDWKHFINDLLLSSGYSYSEFAALCGISRNTVVSWCEKGKVPRSREQFVKIGFAVKMTPAEMSDFLRRYGRFPGLNPKNIDDAVTIFALNNQLGYDRCIELKARFSATAEKMHDKVKACEESLAFYYDTQGLESELLSVNTIMQFQQFFEQNIDAFAESCSGLIDFINSYVALNSLTPHGSLNALLNDFIDDPAIVSHFNTMISKLRCHGKIPSRTELIALGIHLRMTADEINLLLQTAGMERLCARDKLESLIIFAAESAVLLDPGIEITNADRLKYFTHNPKIKQHCDEIIRRYDLCDVVRCGDIDIYEYITQSLMSLDNDTADEILHLLGKC